MFEFDIDKVQFKSQNIIVYNSFNDESQHNRSMGNIFRDYLDTGAEGDKVGVSWLNPNATIVYSLMKLFYWFYSMNKKEHYCGVKPKYLLIHPKLKAYIDSNNVQMIKQYQYLPNTQDYYWVLKDHVTIEEIDNIPCNKVVIVGDDNNKTCAVITVFSEKDIDKLG